MKKTSVVLSALLLLIAVPALAGHGAAAHGAKCSNNLQSCLNDWAAKKDMGWVGLEYDKSQEGIVKVKAVTPEGPAAAAGFMPGDVLLALNGAKMSDKAAVKKAKGTWKVGQSVTYTIQREGAEKEIAVTLAPTPEHVFASMVGAHMLEGHAAVATAAATSEAKAASAPSKK